MNLLASLKMGHALVRNTWVTPRPYLLYMKPTARCDLRCHTCKRWQEPSRTADELTTDEVRTVLSTFRQLGAAVLVVWGGEPTLRADLGDIFRIAKDLGYRTSMCTNANSLERKGDALFPWLDTLLCSLDGFGENHDRVRRVDGLFERVVSGIRAARVHSHLRIKIWASLHTQNLQDIEPIAKLAQELGVWVEYFPISLVPGYNEEMVLEGAGLRAAFDKVMELKRAGLPVWSSERSIAKLRDATPIRCNFGRIALQVDHKGYVHSCENPDGSPMQSWGRYDAVDWDTLFRSREFAEAREQLSHCDKCRLPCVVELSDGLPSAYAEMFWQSVTR